MCIKKGLYAFKQSSAHGPLQELRRADLERVEKMYAAMGTPDFMGVANFDMMARTRYTTVNTCFPCAE